MITQVTGGGASIAVTTTETDIVSVTSTPKVNVYSLAVSTDQNITVRVYETVGENVGEVLVAGYTTAVTSATPLLLQVAGYWRKRIRVTAQAASTTASVNADFAGILTVSAG